MTMDISYYLIPSILSNVKTGNVFHDCLIIIVVLFCINLLSQSIAKLITYIMEKISNVKFKKKAASSYSMNINIKLDNTGKSIILPKEYYALLHYISKNNIDIVRGRKMSDIKESSYATMKTELIYEINEIADYFVEATDPIKINKDIFLEVVKPSNINNADQKNISYDFTLYSKNLNFIKLRKFVSDITLEYDKFIIEHEKVLDKANDDKHYHFTYIKCKNAGSEQNNDFFPAFVRGGVMKSPNMDYIISNYERKYELERLPFSTNKTFGNIFFEQKILLKNRLDFFLNNPEYYSRLGIPYSFGLMFYGKPGTGKTSTIKAIAKYTKRHIVEIPLSRIKKFNELKNIFFMNKYEHVNLSFENKIIVFEDIDCMNGIIKKRNINDPITKIVNPVFTKINPLPKNFNFGDDMNNMENGDSDNGIENLENSIKVKLNDNDISKKEKIIDKKILKNMLIEDDDPITLQNMLNLIDGVVEQPGRILIFTTNYPDQLDDALIRPGRVDLQLEFKLCSEQIITEIIRHMFEREVSETIKFPEYKYTAAEVIQVCINDNNFENVCDKLLKN